MPVIILKNFFKSAYFAVRGSILRLIKEKECRPLNIKSILVIRIDRIGDVVASLSGIKALREAFPDAKISVLARQGIDRLLEDVSWLDEIIVYRGFIKTIRKLQIKNFDLAMDFLMDYPLKTALLASLSRAKLAAGFDIEERGRLFNIRLIPSKEKKRMIKHILDLAAEVVRSCTGKDIIAQPVYAPIHVPKEKIEKARVFLKKNGVEDSDFLVGIHPGGNFVSQRWPIDKFSMLADRIAERFEAKIIIIGSLKDKALIDKMLGLMAGKALKIVNFPLDEVAAFISLTKLFVANNSGLLHIACSLNVATVSTMGPTDPGLWYPIGENNTVLRKDLGCSPCNKAKCRKHDCLDLISVEEMFRAVEWQMDRIKNKAV